MIAGRSRAPSRRRFLRSLGLSFITAPIAVIGTCARAQTPEPGRFALSHLEIQHGELTLLFQDPPPARPRATGFEVGRKLRAAADGVQLPLRPPEWIHSQDGLKMIENPDIRFVAVGGQLFEFATARFDAPAPTARELVITDGRRRVEVPLQDGRIAP